MPRISEREKRVKNARLNLVPIGIGAAKIERQKALKALAKAKEVEQLRLSNNYKWVNEGKIRRLVKANHEHWVICHNCGAHNDLRKVDYCEVCKTQLEL